MYVCTGELKKTLVPLIVVLKVVLESPCDITSCVCLCMGTHMLNSYLHLASVCHLWVTHHLYTITPCVCAFIWGPTLFIVLPHYVCAYIQSSVFPRCLNGTSVNGEHRQWTPYCSAAQCNAVHCNAVQCNAVRCNVMKCNTVQCNAVHCNAAQCSDM